MLELKDHLRNNKIVIPLVLILALGTFLRIHGIEYQSLSNDELSSWKRSGYEDLSTVVNLGARTDVHPPGYYILLHFVQKIFGDSELALRFPSALFGVLSILLIFLTGLRIYSYREALLAAALMAVLWCPLFYSQDARMYSMLLFFALLSSYLWIMMFETLRSDQPRRNPLIAYAVAAAICAYTHYFGTYLIALHGALTILLFIRRRRALLAVSLVYIAIAVAYLPWIPAMREHLAQGPIWITSPMGGFVHSFFEYLKFVFNDSKKGGDIAAAVLLLLLARTYGEFSVNPTRQSLKRIFNSPGTVLFLWLFAPFAGVYFKSILSTPVLTNRNLIISLPPACILFSRSIMRIPAKSYIHTITSCLAIALITYHLLIPMEYYTKITKDQFRDAVQYLLEENRIDHCPVIIANTNQEGYFDFYLDRLGAGRRVDVHFLSDDDWEAVKRTIDTRNAECIWYLLARGGEGQQHYLLRRNGFDLSDRQAFLHTDVRLYKKNATRREAAVPDLQSQHDGVDSGPARELWINAMKQTAPEDKISSYRTLLRLYPDDPLAPQALYMIGFIYADELHDPLHAKRALEELILRYPESKLIESAQRIIENLNSPLPPREIPRKNR